MSGRLCFRVIPSYPMMTDTSRPDHDGCGQPYISASRSIHRYKNLKGNLRRLDEAGTIPSPTGKSPYGTFPSGQILPAQRQATLLSSTRNYISSNLSHVIYLGALHDNCSPVAAPPTSFRYCRVTPMAILSVRRLGPVVALRTRCSGPFSCRRKEHFLGQTWMAHVTSPAGIRELYGTVRAAGEPLWWQWQQSRIFGL